MEHHRYPEHLQDHSPAGSKTRNMQTSGSPKRSTFKDPKMGKLEQNSLVLSLKKQVNELRKKNQDSLQEISDLKKSTKVCVYNELDV